MMSRVLPVLFILVAVGIFFGYINPTYSGAVNDLREEIRSYDAALRAAQTFREKEAQLMLERNGISQEGLERVESFLPDGVDNVQLILDLNALASRSGVSLSDFDIVDSADDAQQGGALELESEDAVESLDLTVSATGTYAAFKAFLIGTEWSLRPMDLVELSVEDSQTGVYTYQMTFRIYWLR